MPHAALSPLCRMPDYAESQVTKPVWRGVHVLPDAGDSA
jgi:hypothetical protein